MITEGYSFKLPCHSNIINEKGGEKGVTCEWDRLMELPKEELVIELVHARAKFDIFVKSMIEFSKDINSIGICSDGERPSDEWLAKIIDHVKKDNPDFDAYDLIAYGVDYDTVEELDERGKY